MTSFSIFINDSVVGFALGSYSAWGVRNFSNGLEFISFIALFTALRPIGVLLIQPSAVSRRFGRFTTDRDVLVKSKLPIVRLNASIFFSTEPAA